jgi:hypothetical protein
VVVGVVVVVVLVVALSSSMISSAAANLSLGASQAAFGPPPLTKRPYKATSTHILGNRTNLNLN